MTRAPFSPIPHECFDVRSLVHMAASRDQTSGDVRLLIAESDPALRGILKSALNGAPGIRVVGESADAPGVLECELNDVDVVLVDLDHSSGGVSSGDLAVELKRHRPDLGIVMLVEGQFGDPLPRVSHDARFGWAFLAKAADFDVIRLGRAVIACSWGLNIHDPGLAQVTGNDDRSILDALTDRQLRIIEMAATGMDVGSIAERWEMRPVAVRQELSRVYAILVPDPKPGVDLRTVAVLRYLRLTGSM